MDIFLLLNILTLSVALRLWFCDVFGSTSGLQQFLSRSLPFLHCPPHAWPHAGCSLLQVVAAQLFQHPFTPGNEEWQKELTPSFNIKKNKGGKNGGRRLSHSGATDSRVSQNSSLPPKDQPIPELVTGRGTKKLPPVWKSSAILETFSWHSTSRVQEWETQNRSDRYDWELLLQQTCPQLIGHHELQASALELGFLRAQIHWCFLSRNLFGFISTQILHFNVASWPFHYFIFVFWSEGVFVDFMFYYYLVGRTSEIKRLEKCVRFWWLLNTTSPAPAKNGSVS